MIDMSYHLLASQFARLRQHCSETPASRGPPVCRNYQPTTSATSNGLPRQHASSPLSRGHLDHAPQQLQGFAGLADLEEAEQLARNSGPCCNWHCLHPAPAPLLSTSSKPSSKLTPPSGERGAGKASPRNSLGGDGHPCACRKRSEAPPTLSFNANPNSQ